MARHPASEETMAAALDAALDLFAERGLGGLGIAALKERSGLSVGSIYHHFGSRRGVLVALYARSLFALLDALRPPEPAPSARELVSGLVHRYLHWVQSHAPAARFVLCAAPAELDAASLRGLEEGKQARLLPIVAAALALAQSGAIVPLHPSYYELLVIGPIAETARRWLGGAPLDLERAAPILTDAILRGLTPPSPSPGAGPPPSP